MKTISRVGQDARPAVSFLGVGLALLVGTSIPAVHRAVVIPFTELGAVVWAGLLRLLGEEVTRAGTVIVDPAAGFSLQVLDGCNGLFASTILVAAMVAHRAPLLAKLAGALAGLVGIFLANQLRLVALFWIGRGVPEWLEPAHVYVAPAVMVLVALGLWLLWAESLERLRRRRGTGTHEMA